ncbi:hypothetical protein BDW69DRAFT_186073 [Aspergillus filifer]
MRNVTFADTVYVKLQWVDDELKDADWSLVHLRPTGAWDVDSKITDISAQSNRLAAYRMQLEVVVSPLGAPILQIGNSVNFAHSTLNRLRMLMIDTARLSDTLRQAQRRYYALRPDYFSHREERRIFSADLTLVETVMGRITSNIDGLHYVLGLVRRQERRRYGYDIPRPPAHHSQLGSSAGNPNNRSNGFAEPNGTNLRPPSKRPRFTEATDQVPQTDVQPLQLTVTANRQGTMLPQPASMGTSVIVTPRQLNMRAYATPSKSTIKFHHIPGVNNAGGRRYHAVLAINLDLAKSQIEVMSHSPPYPLELHTSIPFPSARFGARPYIRIDVMERDYMVCIGGFFLVMARPCSIDETDITHVSYETGGDGHAFGSQVLVQKMLIEEANLRFPVVGEMSIR